MKKKAALRILASALVLVMTLVPVMSSLFTASAADKYEVLFENPAIPANVGETVDLSKYSVELASNKVTAAKDIAWSSEDITLDGTKVTPASKGVYKLTAKGSSATKTVYLVVKAASENEYVLYYNDFSNASTLSDFTLESSSAAGTKHSISNGKLTLDTTSDSFAGGRLMLPEWLGDFGDYNYFAKATITKANDANRWMSLMYRIQNNKSPYFQLAIRQNAAKENGVELAHKNSGGSWKYHQQKSYKEALSASKYYDISLNVYGGSVSGSINNTVCVSSQAVTEYAKGRLGIQAAGCIASFDEIKVSLILGKDEVKKPVAHANVRFAEANMVLPATMITEVTSKAELDAIATTLPAIAVMTINADGNIIGADKSVIAAADDAVSALQAKTIPAFRIADGVKVADTIEKISSVPAKDIMIVSEDASVIKTARAANAMLLGVLDLSAVEPSNTKLVDVRADTLSSGAKICLLPSAMATQQNVAFLNSLGVTVWFEAKENTNVELLTLITSGANGIISSDITALETALTSSIFEKNTIIRPVSVIGHRGTPALAPENTIDGSILAANNGASIIENDIYITTDDEIVVMHDGTLDRTTNGTGNIESYSLDELYDIMVDIKPTTSEDAFGRIDDELLIPTLEEYFEVFKDTDTFLFIEIKSGQTTRIVKKLAELIKEYDFYAQCGVISFSADAVKETRKQIPEISAGYLCSTSDLGTIITTTSGYGSSYNPDKGALSTENIQQLSARGILTWPWTIRSSEDFDKHYMMGVGGVTTDNSYLAKNYVKHLYVDIPDPVLVFSVGDSASLPLIAETYGAKDGSTRFENKTYTATNAEMILLEGNSSITYSSGKLTASESGTATVMFKLAYKLNNGTTVYTYSQPIKLSAVYKTETLPSDIVTEVPTEPPVTEPAKSGCKSAVLTSGAAVAAVLTLSVAAVFAKKKES